MAYLESKHGDLSDTAERREHRTKDRVKDRLVLFLFALHAYGGASGGLLAPESDLPEGLSESVDDDGGLAVAEALYGEVGSLFGVVGGVPQADHDAVVGQVQADALADGAGLGEGEGREGGDEDDGVGFVGERVENLAGDGGGRKVEGLVVGPLHELDEHVGGEFVSLIAGGDADDGEVALAGAIGVRLRGNLAVG